MVPGFAWRESTSGTARVDIRDGASQHPGRREYAMSRLVEWSGGGSQPMRAISWGRAFAELFHVLARWIESLPCRRGS
jgi:hypothetical protein